MKKAYSNKELDAQIKFINEAEKYMKSQKIDKIERTDKNGYKSTLECDNKTGISLIEIF